MSYVVLTLYTLPTTKWTSKTPSLVQQKQKDTFLPELENNAT